MNADGRGLLHGAITEKVIGAFFEVYNELGVGFLESVYEGAMAVVLSEKHLRVVRQPPITVGYRGVTLGVFRPDLLVEESVVVELKAGRAIEPVHEAQLLNYLRASDLETGLLLNFGPKAEFRRFAFANTRKRDPRSSAFIRGSISSEAPPGPSTA